MHLTRGGAHCGEKSPGDAWASSETNYHINYVELLTALLGLKTFGHIQNNPQIRLRVGNTTAMNIIPNDD